MLIGIFNKQQDITTASEKLKNIKTNLIKMMVNSICIILLFVNNADQRSYHAKVPLTIQRHYFEVICQLECINLIIV